MKVIEAHYNDILIQTPLTLAIGNFDGVHQGHQRLIEKVIEFSDTKHAVMTFDPHPATILRKTPFYLLTRTYDKIEIIKSYPIDYFINIIFDNDFQSLSKEAFIDFLKSIAVKRLILGRDFRFGARGSGNLDDLRQAFEVITVDDILYNQTRISSTYIKDMLDQGHVGEARKLLTRHYQIIGKVDHGNHIGKSLGFPTANIDYDHYVLPKNGVYYVKVGLEHNWHDAMANIGNNPTINYSAKKRLEVYILDFNESLYGKTLTVRFYHYLREEMKFESKEKLVEQLKKDEQTIRKLTLS
jgi:riboflavin kinase / FMN adenylyltransferase